MWFLKLVDVLDKLSYGNGFLCVAGIFGVALLSVAVTIACLCKNSGVYAGIALLIVGGMEGVAFAVDTPIRAATFFRAVSWGTVGVFGLFTTLIIALIRRGERRKRALYLSAKKTECLPERDNTYVRARLHTVLRAEEAGASSHERKSVPYENRGTVRLGYARRLLAGVQDAPLSPAERLETETLARSFEEYALCEKWSAEQLRAVNALFARLLKLAAKYAVEG